jgi:hypothetical protein
MVSAVTRDKDGHLVLQKRDEAGKVTLVPITPQQSQAWEQTLGAYAKGMQYGSVNDMLQDYDVAVPDEAGDSQYRTGHYFGLSDAQIAKYVVPTNNQFENPDLIQLYHPGDTKVDFVLAPKMNGKEPEITQQKVQPFTPTAEPPADMVKALTGTKDPAQREAMIRNYIGQITDDGMLSNTTALLGMDFGSDKDNAEIKRQVADNYLYQYRGADEPTKKGAVDSLLDANKGDDAPIADAAKAAGFPYSPGKVNEPEPSTYVKQSAGDFAKTLAAAHPDQRGTMVKNWLLAEKDGGKHDDRAVDLAKQNFVGKDGKPIPNNSKDAQDIRETIFRTRLDLIPADKRDVRLDSVKNMVGKHQDGEADYWVDYALAKVATGAPFNFKLDDIGNLNDDAKKANQGGK